MRESESLLAMGLASFISLTWSKHQPAARYTKRLLVVLDAYTKENNIKTDPPMNIFRETSRSNYLQCLLLQAQEILLNITFKVEPDEYKYKVVALHNYVTQYLRLYAR